MKIYDKNGIELYDIAVDDSSVRHRAIMTDDSLTLKFSHAESIVIPKYAYCDFEGQRYTLWRPSEFKKHSSREHEYTLVMHGWREFLKFVKFKDMSAKPYRLKFTLAAKPIAFLTVLIGCLNEKDPVGDWVVGDCLDAPGKTISFNHEFCFDVLGRLSTEWETEFEFEGKKIHLRKVEKFKDVPLPLSYGKGNGFSPGVGRYNEGDKQPIGLLFVQGGERNIDYSTYGSPSLLLPKSADLAYNGKTYHTDEHGMSITRVGNNNEAEDSFDASDIYPSRQGTISEVIVVDSGKHFYDIKDASIPEALNYRNCRIAGEKATIKFESGPLSLFEEFDIEQTDNELTGYIHAERRFKIVPVERDGMIVPGGAFVPQVGDKYAIFNISLPDAYVADNATQTGASWDMFREAVRYFAENENDRFNFTGGLDGVWSKNKWLEIGGKILPGSYVLFSDPQFQPDGVPIRIVAVKDYVNKPHKPVVTLSNAPVAASFSSGLGKLEADEVVIEGNRKESKRYTNRQWRDAKETMAMLEDSLLKFSSGINPITIRTMQLIAGDESLQFRFVNSKTIPKQMAHAVTFDGSNKILTANAGIIQHMTIGITKVSPSHKASDYKFWTMAQFVSPPLDEDKAYYLYSKCSKDAEIGTFLLSESPIELEELAGYYHFMMGIINSESNNKRSIGLLYGFTEITPGQITAPMLSSPNGNMYIDLINGVVAGKIRFLSAGVETDLEDYANSTAEDILAAELKAQQAIDKNANVEYLELLITPNFVMLPADTAGVVSSYDKAKAQVKVIHNGKEIYPTLSEGAIKGNILREWDAKFDFKYWGGTGEFVWRSDVVLPAFFSTENNKIIITESGKLINN